MRIKAFVVIDTNVLVSALLSHSEAPFRVVELVKSGNIIPIFDKRILKEYYEVFQYDKFKSEKHLISEEISKDLLYTIVKNGIFINDVEKIKDEFYNIMNDKKDIPFFEVKESSYEFNSMLVTGNVKHYAIPNDSSIVNSKELLNIMNQMERFVKIDIDYESVVIQLIKENLDTPKYTDGDDLLDDIFEGDNDISIKHSYFKI